MKPRPPSGRDRPQSGAGQHYQANLASNKYFSGPAEFNTLAAKNMRNEPIRGGTPQIDEDKKRKL